MAVSRSTKYAAATAATVVALYLAYRLYVDAMTQPRDGSRAGRIIVLALCLYVVVGVVTVLRAYYKRSRDAVADKPRSGMEAEGLAMLGAARLKSITIQLAVNDKEFAELDASGGLRIAPGRFNVPVRTGDIVEANVSSGVYAGHIRTKVARIDGPNQRIVLERLG